jgi:hypothetical protein
MHPDPAPSLTDADVAMPAVITVVGLLGATCAATLRSAGHAVAVDTSVEFGRLERSDLLVLALAPPEPTAGEVIAHVRRRSDIPVLAFEPPPPGVAAMGTAYHAPGGLVVCHSEAELVAGVERLAPRGEPVIDLRGDDVLVSAD